jgi:hypothetical protein
MNSRDWERYILVDMVEKSQDQLHMSLYVYDVEKL